MPEALCCSSLDDLADVNCFGQLFDARSVTASTISASLLSSLAEQSRKHHMRALHSEPRTMQGSCKPQQKGCWNLQGSVFPATVELVGPTPSAALMRGLGTKRLPHDAADVTPLLAGLPSVQRNWRFVRTSLMEYLYCVILHLLHAPFRQKKQAHNLQVSAVSVGIRFCSASIQMRFGLLRDFLLLLLLLQLRKLQGLGLLDSSKPTPKILALSLITGNQLQVTPVRGDV